MKGVFAFLRKHRGTVQAITVALIGYTSGVIINLVTQKPGGGADFWVLLAGGLASCLILTILAIPVNAFWQTEENKQRREYNTHRSGYQTLNREISEYIGTVRRLAAIGFRIEDVPLMLMQNACKDLYDTLETEYGLGVSVREHIEFEVTFMTRSIDDGAITVAAWGNRDGRAPKSLARRKHDVTVYEGTETDKLYADPNVRARYVRSTDSQTYKELYPGQKSRIKSSVIYPVVDDRFELVGTLVVHCDRESFFQEGDDKLWRELLEPYTKRLALARVGVEKLRELGHSVSFQRK